MKMNEVTKTGLAGLFVLLGIYVVLIRWSILHGAPIHIYLLFVVLHLIIIGWYIRQLRILSDTPQAGISKGFSLLLSWMVHIVLIMIAIMVFFLRN
ncbi:hypothetical protein [Chitinophaga nivalis]|uniref:Uncharacterized protein n=1 Tax=Chitinophaga nivalis TaxID=2991709 RepID=A0ABT3IK06_9BACT|nr:hypothetical protein [Chitinophaga nivalis]MCW3466220.1 hypothetical protein [Chitinophaga nivalis]MCW3484089.1 hypothetical protein [Chitinophaga nivalis]